MAHLSSTAARMSVVESPLSTGSTSMQARIFANFCIGFDKASSTSFRESF